MVLGVGHLEGSCAHYAKHGIAVYARSRIVKGISIIKGATAPFLYDVQMEDISQV